MGDATLEDEVVDGRDVVLSVKGLKKVYASSSGDVEAVRDLTFDLRRGEFVCLVGPSGSGKTTLLKCISGLLRPTAGSVEVDGVPVSGPPRNMALVFQEYGRSLYPWLRVAENVELPLKVAGVPRDERRARVDDALRAVGLAHVPKSYPWQLSGGMQQRANLCRALIHEPELLMLDEPFGALDAFTREELWCVIRDLHAASGVTIVLVTHDLREAIFLADRVFVMSSRPGRVLNAHEIQFPRPRELDLIYDPEFSRKVQELHSEIAEARQAA